MNKEYKIQFEEFLKLCCVVIFALLYALGGIEYKWIRRFIAPLWLTGSMFYFSRDWKVFIQAPLLMITLSFGYGADQILTKVLKRGIFGLANSSTASIHSLQFKGYLFKDNWKLLLFHIILCVFICIFFGVFNPFNSARAEEMIIGLFIGLLPIYMVKRKEK